VHIHALGKRELRSFTQHIFPGLEIPETVARRLRRMSGGLSVTVASYLQYLLRTGRIRTDGARYSWVQSGEDEEEILPANPLSVSWYLIRSLHDDAFLMLYAIHLAGGLLDRDGLLGFLQAEGFEGPAIDRSLEGLLASGLMVEGEQLIPRFPGLRRKLEELLGEQGARLRDAFVAYLVTLWEKGSYPHQVLLFTFLARNGRTGLALRVLPAVIRRRIDEGDAAGARAFCDPSRLDFSAAPSPAEKKSLGLITTLGTLQAALLEGKLDECARAVAALGREAGRGEALVACATVDLAAGDAASALDRLKKALLGFQEAGDQAGERSAYLVLGITMMGDGRTGEAVEYLGLSERLSLEASDQLAALRAGVALAGCLFIEGRYSRCLAQIEAALARARVTFQRDAELFLRFLEARVHFQLGSYEHTGNLLQACLAHAELYSIDPAMPVLASWLGRAVLYLGDLPRGIACLERLEPCREVLLFLAEGLLLSREPERALQRAQQALSLPDDGRFPPPLGPGWKDGFWCVEGRCFRLSRSDALLRRSLSGFRAYLLGLTGSPAEAARELHGLTRGGKQVEEDPSAFMAHYLYSLVLLDSAPDQLDDKATVLGKALKGLQERASRIDTPVQRSAFLTLNLWNRRIMEDARARKLV
jgi:tetratricopeptide (TPR) repeat protein